MQSRNAWETRLQYIRIEMLSRIREIIHSFQF